MTVQIHISEEDFPAFLAYLGIGTLYAMRNETVPPQVGIWTLAPPRVCEFLSKLPNVPGKLIRVYRTADELSAIKQLLPNQYTATVDKLIKQLESVLTHMEDQTWSVQLTKVKRKNLRVANALKKTKARKR